MLHFLYQFFVLGFVSKMEHFSFAVALQNWREIGTVSLYNGLVSFDNSIIIAALATRLSGRWRMVALLFGIGLAMALRAFFLSPVSDVFNFEFDGIPYVRLLSGLALILLSVLGIIENRRTRERRVGNVIGVILTIAWVDFLLSWDNILVIVNLSTNYEVIVIGTWISMLVLVLVVRGNLYLMERLPSLPLMGYVLVGFLGVLMLAEDMYRLNTWVGRYVFIPPYHQGEYTKLLIALAVITLGVMYDLVQGLRRRRAA